MREEAPSMSFARGGWKENEKAGGEGCGEEVCCKAQAAHVLVHQCPRAGQGWAGQGRVEVEAREGWAQWAFSRGSTVKCLELAIVRDRAHSAVRRPLDRIAMHQQQQCPRVRTGHVHQGCTRGWFQRHLAPPDS